MDGLANKDEPAIKKTLEVIAKRAFGRVDYYPHNEAARDFCALAGKPNLPRDWIMKLRKMGYEVKEVIEPTL